MTSATNSTLSGTTSATSNNGASSLMSAHQSSDTNNSNTPVNSYHNSHQHHGNRHHHHHHHHHQQHHQAPHHKDHMFLKKRTFTRTFDLSQIAEDPMDNYLDTLGLWKKRIARDGSCLFRAVAEQIYPCQMYHEKVRLECIQYMIDHKEEYSKHLTSITFEDYIEAMKNPFEYGGQLEIAAMSKLYRRDFIIYQAPDQAGIDVTLNGFPLKINLCYSYNHFDAIFTKEHRDRLALIQSLVYEILYDRVFGSGEQVSVARRLLRKSDTIYPKEYMNDVKNYDDLIDHELYEDYDSDNIDHDDVDEMNDDDDDEENDQSSHSDDSAKSGENAETQEKSNDINNNDEQVLNKNEESKKSKKPGEASSGEKASYDKSLSAMQKMPLPYKVAKSLDPVIYRNTAFDAWLAAKREHEEIQNQKAISVLQPGDKCLVRLSNNYGEKWNTAYIHNLHPDSANVFIADLNEHHFVSLENLKAYNDGHHHYGHHSSGEMKGSSAGHPHHGSQNVQKLVQSLNQQFAKVFVNSDNKRRNMSKKKQFSMVKKSSSFHAFSTELPPLPEVNEDQLDDPFHYASLGYMGAGGSASGAGHAGRYYFNTQMHPHSHHQNPHGLSHGMMMGGGGHHHQSGNGPYYSMPHSHSHHAFTDVSSSNSLNAPAISSSNNKSNSQGSSSNVKSSNMPSSVSNPNLRSSAATTASKMPPSQSASNMSAASSGNFGGANSKNRRQRYGGFNQNIPSGSNQPANNNMNNFNYVNYPNSSANQGSGGKGVWNSSSFNSNSVQTMSTGNQSIGSLSNQYPMGMQPPPQPSLGPSQQQPSAPGLSHGSLPHVHHQGPHQIPSSSSFSGAPIQAPPLLNSNPGFPLQPPPLAGSLPLHSQIPSGSLPHPPLPPAGSSYMQHPPPMPMPPHPGNMNQQRPGYFNPSNMFQQPIGHMAPSLLQHPSQHSNNPPYYFPSNGQSNLHNNNSNAKPSNDRKRNDNFNNFASKSQPQSSIQSSNSSTPSTSTTASAGTSSSSAPNQQSNQVPINTSNYLLMPVPTANLPQHQQSSALSGSASLQHSSSNYPNVPGSVIGNSNGAGMNAGSSTGSNNNSNNLSRSHSYHGNMGHDSSAAASSGYIDIQYQAPIPAPHLLGNQAGNNASTAGNSLTSASNLASGCLNNLNSTMNANSTGNSNGISNLTGINDLNGANYGSSFNNYADASYSRFDSTSGLSTGSTATNTNTLIDENLLNAVSQTSFNDQRQQSQQNIVWNKGTKFGKNNNLFTSDGSYSGNSSEISNPQSQIPPAQQQPFFYSNNCFVVNIEGPINFNATHSLLDDGSDLPMNDVNTIRFFYNLGIEYYRLNIAPNPYQQIGNYQAAASGCYLPPGAQLVPPQPPSLPMLAPPMAQMAQGDLQGASNSKSKNEPKLKENPA